MGVSQGAHDGDDPIAPGGLPDVVKAEVFDKALATCGGVLATNEAVNLSLSLTEQAFKQKCT